MTFVLRRRVLATLRPREHLEARPVLPPGARPVLALVDPRDQHEGRNPSIVSLTYLESALEFRRWCAAAVGAGGTRPTRTWMSAVRAASGVRATPLERFPSPSAVHVPTRDAWRSHPGVRGAVHRTAAATVPVTPRIGREGCDVVLPDPDVSRRHAILRESVTDSRSRISSPRMARS